ncbi:autotransporter domain-containing protein [Caulobacter sp. S45]|uniref:autotransporter domain-containing protein n=1 Tax=Caulobacter sp. S45 TaxID=1641861 RepID=UPI001576912D|nr:autotransporter outer membrane beta-barrel domain-containing protein [Caulobacter sp. S45]
MRRTLVAAVALAPLCLVAGRALAQTTDTISSGVNAPIATATAGTGGESIDVSAGGSVTVTGSAPAITLNSGTAAVPNNVSVEGSVSISGVNNSVAIQGLGGAAGSITNSGSITNNESYTPTANGDGFNEAPFASLGSVGRFGIQVTGTGPLIGDVDNLGTITVQGDSSYAISIESPLTGSLFNSGTISYVGDGGVAVRSLPNGSISGDVTIAGAITAQGQTSSAINLAGNVGGRLSIYSAISSTGYATTTRPTTTSTLNNLQESANVNQVEQSAGAVIIGGSVGQGIFIGAPPVSTSTSTVTTTDLDGDGIADVDEGSGSITNFGSAPALTIGGTGTTSIGEFVGLEDTNPGVAAGSNDYGLIIRGAVAGEGVFDGVSATGLQIGTGALNSSVTVDGGVRVVGSVSADAFEANATAIHIMAGANVPEIRNEDFIEASVSNSVVSATDTAGLVNTNAVSSGIVIEKNAFVGAVTNFGTIQATANGDTMQAYGVQDLSGSLTKITNEGVISATVTPVTSNLTLPSTANLEPDIALDLRANTTGVVLDQMVNPNPLAVEVSTTTDASGTVTTTAALTTATASTTTTVTTTTAGVTTTTTTTTPTYPQIIGDVLLGSGTNTVNILGGSVTGALSLGSGANDVFTLGDANDAAIYEGRLSYGNTTVGSGLQLNVVNGSLINTNPANLNLASLHVGGSGLLYAAIDPQNQASTTYTVSGTATLDPGARLGIVLNSPLFTPTTYTIVQANTLVDNSGGALALAQVPYVLQASETSSNNSILVTLRRSTATELGLNPAESAALNGVYSSLTNDPAIEGAVLGQYSKSSFLNVYDQLLPDYAGGVFELTLAASDAVTRATSRVNDIENPSGTRGAWAEEVAFGVNKSRSSQSAGFQGGGFGFVGGLETGGAGLGAFGLTGSFLTGDIKDPHSPGDNLSSFSEGEGGAYWQAQLGGLRADARVAGGYLLYGNRRELLLKDVNGNVTLDRASKSSSSGYTATGHFGLGYQTPQIGWVYFRPQLHGDYFYLDQGGFTEHGATTASGGDGFDLTDAARNGNEASGTASLVTGVTFGQGFKWRPELELGYRNVFSGNAGSTTANFQGGTPFTLDPESVKGGGPVARLDVKADTDFYELNFEAGVEERTHFEEGDLRLSVRVLF